jgi:hypothetical protein
MDGIKAGLHYEGLFSFCCLTCHLILTELVSFCIGLILRSAFCQQFSQFKN